MPNAWSDLFTSPQNNGSAEEGEMVGLAEMVRSSTTEVEETTGQGSKFRRPTRTPAKELEGKDSHWQYLKVY